MRNQEYLQLCLVTHSELSRRALAVFVAIGDLCDWWRASLDQSFFAFGVH